MAEQTLQITYSTPKRRTTRPVHRWTDEMKEHFEAYFHHRLADPPTLSQQEIADHMNRDVVTGKHRASWLYTERAIAYRENLTRKIVKAKRNKFTRSLQWNNQEVSHLQSFLHPKALSLKQIADEMNQNVADGLYPFRRRYTASNIYRKSLDSVAYRDRKDRNLRSQNAVKAGNEISTTLLAGPSSENLLQRNALNSGDRYTHRR
ncbi:hypothetical protein B7494_g668 [Chlorociboria aeruginascens]|nr:hypothetical protein B7494_g668 [Chlorociboria aeruginascens]